MQPEPEVANVKEPFERRKHLVGRLLYWVRSLIVEDVPPAMARCEFGCKVEACREADWQNCANRLREARK